MQTIFSVCHNLPLRKTAVGVHNNLIKLIRLYLYNRFNLVSYNGSIPRALFYHLGFPRILTYVACSFSNSSMTFFLFFINHTNNTYRTSTLLGFQVPQCTMHLSAVALPHACGMKPGHKKKFSDVVSISLNYFGRSLLMVLKSIAA